MRNPELSEDEQHRQVNMNFEKCFENLIKKEVLMPLFEDIYMHTSMHKEYCKKVHKTLIRKLNFVNNNICIRETVDHPVIFRELLPKSFFVIQKTTKTVYFIPKADIESPLQAIIKFDTFIETGLFNFVISCKDFKDLFNEFKKRSSANSMVINEAKRRLLIEGRLNDVCFCHAWVKYFTLHIDKIVINAIEGIPLKENIPLLNLIVKSTGLKEFCVTTFGDGKNCNYTCR